MVRGYVKHTCTFNNAKLSSNTNNRYFVHSSLSIQYTHSACWKISVRRWCSTGCKHCISVFLARPHWTNVCRNTSVNMSTPSGSVKGWLKLKLARWYHSHVNGSVSIYSVFPTSQPKTPNTCLVLLRPKIHAAYSSRRIWEDYVLLA